MLIHVPNFMPSVKRLPVPSAWKNSTFLDPDGEIFVGSFYSGVDYLYVNKAPWHTDKGHPPFSALLVVKNTGVAVQTWGKSPVVAAPGDLIYMNIHKTHKAHQVKEGGRLLVLVSDYHSTAALPEIKQDFTNVLKQFKTQVPKDVVY